MKIPVKGLKKIGGKKIMGGKKMGFAKKFGKKKLGAKAGKMKRMGKMKKASKGKKAGKAKKAGKTKKAGKAVAEEGDQMGKEAEGAAKGAHILDKLQTGLLVAGQVQYPKDGLEPGEAEKPGEESAKEPVKKLDKEVGISSEAEVEKLKVTSVPTIDRQRLEEKKKQRIMMNEVSKNINSVASSVKGHGFKAQRFGAIFFAPNSKATPYDDDDHEEEVTDSDDDDENN